MARIRTIKPEFFTSEDIVNLSPLARLLYIAIWCEADKEGRLTWKPITFKLRYFPGDSCDIQAMCNEILDGGLVKLYGEGLAYMPTFTRHQHINPRESISLLPVPDGFIPDRPRKVSGDVREEVMERDGHKCVRCNAKDDLTLDHILPQSLNGPHIAENLRCMCRSCNSGRAVSGKGLADDLSLDGLSVESLRVQFGIDASPRVTTRANLDRNAQGGREGKGKEGDIRDESRDDLPAGFADFWKTWPKTDRKQAQGKCLDAWKKAHGERDAAVILAHVQNLKSSASWSKNNGEFIPAPLVYLNKRSWEGAELEMMGSDQWAGAVN